MKSIFCKMVAELESEKSFQSLEYVSNAHNKAAALRTILILEFQKKRTDVETSLHHCLVNEKGSRALADRMMKCQLSLKSTKDSVDENGTKKKAESSLLKRIKEMGDNITDQLPSGEAMALDKSEESLALNNDSFRAETLRSSLDHLNNETELMEMHDRYSQLSLKVAEVEGETKADDDSQER
ncbi:hypothetical protein HID58_030628 [Brassica napus]|uniref:Uncharacterized protein n=1 Tax=Brassica napus TaxID=3708 RepID=A0ABQ8CGI4_BRANA|nr:hypothetical protein HID58_030628 [Brassica napus]